MKNSQKGFVIPLVIAIVAILAIGGTVYLAENEKPEMVVDFDTDLIQSTSTVSNLILTDTSDWKTYKNVDYGLEFKYPSEYTIVRENAEYIMLRDLDVKTGLGNDDPGKMITVYLRNGDSVESVMCRKIDIMCVHNIKQDPLRTLDQRKVMSYTVTRHDLGADIGFAVSKDNFFVLIETTQYGTGAGEARADISGIATTLKFTAPATEKPIACTMDAFMCPDGSYVGRSGPKCEFVCPAIPVLPPPLTVLSPNGGEAFVVGEKQIIRWSPTYSTHSDTVSISLVGNLSGCHGLAPGTPCLAVVDPIFIIASSTPNTGSYTWDVGGFISVEYGSSIRNGNYYIKICDGKNKEICDSSEKYFSISSAATSSNTEVKIGQSITINDLRITPLEVTSDSRCPKATQCVWAGTVDLTVRLQSGDMVQKVDLTLDKAYRFDTKMITLTKVLPVKTLAQVNPADYGFGFFVYSVK